MDFSAAASGAGNECRPASSPADARGEAGAENASIIIVEDDFLIATDLEHDLTGAGYKVVGIASSAAEAIELARRTCPHIAIMDVRLANDSDGVDAALVLYRDLKIRSVFATAHSDPKTRDRAKPAYPLGWLPKPYSTQSLIEFLRKVLSR